MSKEPRNHHVQKREADFTKCHSAERRLMTNTNIHTAGRRGPAWLSQVLWLIEKLAHFREPRGDPGAAAAPPKRLGGHTEHSRGSRHQPLHQAQGFFRKVGPSQTRLFVCIVRLSERGGLGRGADGRGGGTMEGKNAEIRGHRPQFYTRTANWASLGNNTPVFFFPRSDCGSVTAIMRYKRDPRNRACARRQINGLLVRCFAGGVLHHGSRAYVRSLVYRRVSFILPPVRQGNNFSMINCRQMKRVWVKFPLPLQGIGDCENTFKPDAGKRGRPMLRGIGGKATGAGDHIHQPGPLRTGQLPALGRYLSAWMTTKGSRGFKNLNTQSFDCD